MFVLLNIALQVLKVNGRVGIWAGENSKISSPKLASGIKMFSWMQMFMSCKFVYFVLTSILVQFVKICWSTL